MDDYVSTVSKTVVEVCQITAAKCVATISFIIANIAFGRVDIAVLIGVLVLTIFDFITALAREYKAASPITSRKAIRTPLKMVVYAIMVSAGYVTESVIGMHKINLPIAETIAGFIAVTELISVLENVGKMGYVIPAKLLNMLVEYTGKQ